jgi:hypothetical protein
MRWKQRSDGDAARDRQLNRRQCVYRHGPDVGGSAVMTPRKIITHYEFPPIPDRRWDFIAYYDGEEESGHCGYGETEAEAIEDLKRLDEERAEANEDLPWWE